jgi:phenylalanyl-tRNA synthetase alpha chain
VEKAIHDLRTEFQNDIVSAHSTQDLEVLKVKFLGKKGSVQGLMQSLKNATVEERPILGKHINELKEEITLQLEAKKNLCVEQEEQSQLANEKIDITLPGRRRFLGGKHPITREIDLVVKIAAEMGFSVQTGPDIDSEYYNFEALNFPPEHPARDMQDTFYISPETLLRTHTSNVQVRVMEAHRPPIRIIAPGKAYRNEAITARSHVFFHQHEGLYIDKGVSFADLMATMRQFLSKLFNKDVETRFRPSYFPFVEPGMEIDVRCLMCEGHGCALCKHTGWLEVAGAGMVHPEVLKSGGIDPEVYTGYAWGMGVERTIMLKYGIRDIRLFVENDLRFLSQMASL